MVRQVCKRLVVVAAVLLLGILTSSCPMSMDPGFYGTYGEGLWMIRLADPEYSETAIYQAIYYPSQDGVTVDPNAGECPLIMFAPGFNVPPLLYDSYGRQFASWGYIVHMTWYFGFNNVVTTQDLSDHLDWMLEQNADPSSRFYQKIDESKIAVGGHSMGAKYVVMACMEDDRFITGISLDPVDGAAGNGNAAMPNLVPERMDEVDEPILYIGAEYPSIFTPVDEDFWQFYSHSTSPAMSLRVLDSDHISFIDDVGGVLDFMGIAFGDHPDVDHDKAKNTAIRYIISWCNVFLKDDDSYWDYLTGPFAQQDVADALCEIHTNDALNALIPPP